LENQKQEIQTILEKHNAVPKKRQIETDIGETVSNLNKKSTTQPEIEKEEDTFYIKSNQPQTTTTTQQQPKTTQPKPKSKKQIVPVTEVLNVRTKRHRGINVPYDENEPKQGTYSPKQSNTKQSTSSPKQSNTQQKQSTTTQQTQPEEQREQKEQTNTNDVRSPNTPKRGGRNPRGRRGQYPPRVNIESDREFPSLSGNIKVETPKPYFYNNSNN